METEETITVTDLYAVAYCLMQGCRVVTTIPGPYVRLLLNASAKSHLETWYSARPVGDLHTYGRHYRVAVNLVRAAKTGD